MTGLYSFAARWRTTPAAAAFVVFIVVVGMAFAAVAGFTVPRYATVEFFVLATLAIIADVLVPREREDRWLGQVYLSVCFTFVIMLVWGVGVAIVVQSAATAVAAGRSRLGFAEAALTWGRFVCALTAAGAVLNHFGTTAFRIDVHISYANIGVVLAPALAWLVVSVLIGILATRLHEGSWWFLKAPAVGYQVLITSGLILIGPVLMSEPTGLMTMLVIVPLLAVSWAARRYGDQERRMFHDPLTGLLNRRGLMAELNAPAGPGSGRRSEQDGSERALLLVGLEDLGAVTETVGRSVHDELQVMIGRSLGQTVDGRGAVGRLSEDEFVVITWDRVDQAEAEALAGAICRSLDPPISVRGVPFDISTTVGIVLARREQNLPDLVRAGDMAIADARRYGEAIQTYSPQAEVGVAERLDLLADISLAIEDPDHLGEITMRYQPQASLATGDMIGVEALVRWHHPRRGSVNSEDLLRVVEHSAVMPLLTARVLNDVVRQLQDWAEQGLNTRVSVNVSMRDLHDGRFVERVAHALANTGIGAESLTLEVTEGALVTDSQRVLTTVRALAEIGISLSLDDFGTGYSSIQHLHDLPLTELKIDRSFVSTMATDPHSAAIVQAIIQLADALGLRTVAEGIEDEQTYRLLADAGCEVGQGWFFGRPMPAADLLSRAAHPDRTERAKGVPRPTAVNHDRRPARRGAGARPPL